MNYYEVHIDRNTSSQSLGVFDDFEKAKSCALSNIEKTNPDYESEGINIYNEEGIVMTLSKGQEPIYLNPKNTMPYGINELKELRKTLNLTQAQIAETTGLRRQTIADVENGKDSSTATLVKIAKALGCTLNISFVPTK